MNNRNANTTDVLVIKKLLNHSNLPSNDFEKHIENFIVIEENNTIIGLGGLEAYDKVGLVRSIVVESNYRNNGIAKDIYLLIEKRAYNLGIRTLYLLTDTATEYFRKLGFKIKKRSDVPIPIMETKQFKEFCPSSATLMFREI